MLKASIILLALLTLTACADVQVGNEATNDFGKYAQLDRNDTTKMQVYSLFGQPSDVNYKPDGSSEWTSVSLRMRSAGATYIPYVNLLAGGTRQKIRVATFRFDPRGRFQSVETTEHSVYANNWEMLARASGSAGSPAFARVASEMQKLGLPYDEKSIVPPELYNSPRK